jgi:dinuclear metal center YbgI/SA1388 family protein
MTAWLDSLLEPSRFDDHTWNGLQVEGNPEIKRVGFSVDSSLAAFREAADADVDFLIVHHGLIWGGWKRLAGYELRRLECLLSNSISLYVSHLPLDAHREIGHNVEIARHLGAEISGSFGPVGYEARFDPPLPFEVLLSNVRRAINPSAHAMTPSASPIRRIGISSGGFDLKLLDEALSKGLDAVVTGEPSGQSMFYHPAAEAGIGLIFAGHYETEVFGLLALEARMKEKFGECMETLRVGTPTGW